MSNQQSLTTFRRQTKQILFEDNVCLVDRKSQGSSLCLVGKYTVKSMKETVKPLKHTILLQKQLYRFRLTPIMHLCGPFSYVCSCVSHCCRAF